MRILHVCQPTDGGAAVVVRQLTAAGVRLGDDVTVACPADGPLASWVTSVGAAWIELPMRRGPDLMDAQHVGRLRQLHRQFDVVHAHSSKAGALVRLAAILSTRSPRVVFTPHGWSWYVGGRAAFLYRWFERVTAGGADVITVVSPGELDDGRAVLGPAAALELIENGVDTDDFTPAGPAAHGAGGPLLVQVGRLSRQKGQDRSVRALARVADRSSRLRLVGSGPFEPELRDLAASLGLLGRVEFAGTDDPRPHLRAADVVVLPSRWEGMSLALLEAMSVGATVVASDCAGTSALGDTGLTIDHADDDRAVTELAGHIDRLVGEPWVRAAMGTAARRRVEASYGLGRVVDHYQRVWRDQRQTAGPVRSDSLVRNAFGM